MKIFVYIIPTSKNSNKKKLEKFFKCNKYFEVIECYNTKNDLSIHSALKNARKRDKKSYVITIEDTSISSSSVDILYDTIKQVIPSFPCYESTSNSSSSLSRSYSKLSRSKSCSSDSCLSRSYSKLSRSKSCSSNSCLSNSCSSNSCSWSDTSCEDKCYDWDLFYLGDYLDCCEKFQKWCNSKNSKMIKILRTFSPNGTQALLWSPKGRDRFLGKIPMRNKKFIHHSYLNYDDNLSLSLNREIREKNLIALTSKPIFFTFDVLFSKSPEDLLKLCECAPCEDIKNEDSLEEFDNFRYVPLVSFVIFSIIVVLIISLAWFTYTMYGIYH